MKKCRNYVQLSRLLILSGFLLALIFILSGCQETADSLMRRGDSYYGSGEKYKALEAYSQAQKLDPGDKRIQKKAEAVRSEILHDGLRFLAVSFLALVLTVSLPVLIVRHLTPEAAGRGFIYRLKLVSGFMNWHEAEELRADYHATRDFLVKRKIYSYLRPLSEILHEFFLMRDIRVSSHRRLDELNRILQKDVAKLEELAAAADDPSFAQETRTAASAYKKRVMQQKQSIMEFAEAYEQRRRLFHGFLIDLRTRLDLNEKFDGLSEINRLSQQISAARKTYMSVEKSWST